MKKSNATRNDRLGRMGANMVRNGCNEPDTSVWLSTAVRSL